MSEQPKKIRCPNCGGTMRLIEFDFYQTTKIPKSPENCFYGCDLCELALAEHYKPKPRSKKVTTFF